jgi:hypothetical protein
LNDKRLGEAVLQADSFMDEARARAINAEPREPPSGMVKRQCPWCRYLFAAAADSQERRCPDCIADGSAAA